MRGHRILLRGNEAPYTVKLDDMQCALSIDKSDSDHYQLPLDGFIFCVAIFDWQETATNEFEVNIRVLDMSLTTEDGNDPFCPVRLV